jgi:type 2 lantibiotic biosynthesis protein LanM
MDAFYERLIVRAATIDELLSDDFEPLSGQKGDADLAARRLAAWCQSCASGDWILFGRRLERDGLSMDRVQARFAAVQRKASAIPPPWIKDAVWIEAALHSRKPEPTTWHDRPEAYAFEDLFTPLVAQADRSIWKGIGKETREKFSDTARASLRDSLLKEISGLSTPAIYERFVDFRKAKSAPPCTGTSNYEQFIADLRAGGFRPLFEDKPVLLRLIATMTRQWIDTSRELIQRLDADWATICRGILDLHSAGRVAAIEGNLADPHNGGRSVQIVTFEDGARVVYKPKDLRLDTAWHALVEQLNVAAPPFELKAVRAIARDGYGWTEFIDHKACADSEAYIRYFQRAGAWLALLHSFATTDMHQENIIASGNHPVPIDLETILQATPETDGSLDPETQAYDAATETIANSIMMVGLLPAYGRGVDNNVFAIGGMTSNLNIKINIKWDNINTDAMRPTKLREVGKTVPNLPHVGDQYAKFTDHIEYFISGFEAYAKFLLRCRRDNQSIDLFDGFAGVPVRTVIRPTRFYYMLLQRLKNHRAMDDGAIWSAQADFIARLADWEKDSDPLWQLQCAERSALIALNVPHFVSTSNGNKICDATGISVGTKAMSGLERAKARTARFDEKDIAWQVTVIRQNTGAVSKPDRSPKRPSNQDATVSPTKDYFIAEAGKIADELTQYAIRRGPGAAWIGLDWLGDSENFQLVCLGADLYNGVSGIAVFLAAHAAVSGRGSSGELALAGIAHLRKELKGRSAARVARSLGIGGASGMGSIVYALTVMAKNLNDDGLLADAHRAAALFTDDLIAADKQLDVIGGSAGAILGLLRLYRDTQSGNVLARATKCGEHLLSQSQPGPEGRRRWSGLGSGPQGLNGMSHGAAGFAYAFASLSAATGRDDFSKAASECISFENASYDPERANWPDLRAEGESSWPCQWCHGAPGVGLARIATLKNGDLNSDVLRTDIGNALKGVERGWLGPVDTLCCGALGSIEFFCDAGRALGRSDLVDLAAKRLATVLESAAANGDFRWNSGNRRFNLGLFRGLAGVGYTALRQADPTLPNILTWE